MYFSLQSVNSRCQSIQGGCTTWLNIECVSSPGFNVEKVQYKNVVFTVWDVGGQEKLRPLWRHYFNNTDALIFVVDCQDRDRIERAANEFKVMEVAVPSISVGHVSFFPEMVN